MVLASATDVQAQMRFQGMDRNNDGVISRVEWRGNDQSFRNQDWNGDGILSGEEVRPGGRRQTWNQDWNRDGRVDNQDTQIAQRFRGYDMNNDNRVAANEWPAEQRLFTRLDANRDRFLSIQEYTTGAGFRLDAQGGPTHRFSNIDLNRNGWIARSEWRMDAVEFDRIDINNDNRITRFEFENTAVNDADRPVHRRSAAWRTGYDRGISEGRPAGREDFVRNQGWDLEGQRELVGADAGYTPQMGSLERLPGRIPRGVPERVSGGILRGAR